MTEDEKYMRRCLQLARNGEGLTEPNPMVGAVIVHNGRIIGEGWHRQYGGPHAEVNAVRSVRPEDIALLREATIYASLEPCSHWGKTPPCAELLAEKGFRRVVAGCLDPNRKVAGQGIHRLREAGIEVEVGILEAECLQLNRHFITRHTKQRPFITLKWAESADGFMDRHRNSFQEAAPVKFSTPWTQMLVHRLRATHTAILVGRRTQELDKPSLTTRLWPGNNPQRVILSSANGSLEATLQHLYEQGHTSLLVEGGAQTLQSFIDRDLWDEAYIERSDIILGNGVKAPEIKTDTKERPIHVNFA